MRTLKNILTGIGLALGIATAFLAPERVEAQGASTNNYSGTGPQGPFTLATQPNGIGGALPYYQAFSPNLSLGTNALGVPTNQVMGVTTNVFQPTNTTFLCADYENVGFQLTGNISNAVYAHAAIVQLALSLDGISFDTVQDQILISLPTNPGPFCIRTNIAVPSEKAIDVVNIQSPTANSTTYYTNLAALFTGKAARKHVNTTAN